MTCIDTEPYETLVPCQEFLLPDLSAARDYLQDSVLQGRLLRISRAATAQLENGVPTAGTVW